MLMRLLAFLILLLPFSTALAEWSPCGPERLQHVYSFAVAPGNPEVLLVLGSLGSIDEQGALRTEDGGKSWRPLFLDESDGLLPEALFVTRSTRSNYASVGLDLYESRDGGRAWRRIGTVADPEFPLEQVSLFSLDVTADEIIAGVG